MQNYRIFFMCDEFSKNSDDIIAKYSITEGQTETNAYIMPNAKKFVRFVQCIRGKHKKTPVRIAAGWSFNKQINYGKYTIISISRY